MFCHKIFDVKGITLLRLVFCQTLELEQEIEILELSANSGIVIVLFTVYDVNNFR